MNAILLVIHVTLAIVINGGALVIGGLMATQLDQPKETSLPILRAGAKLEGILGPAAVLVPIFGLGLLFSSKPYYELSQLWAWLSLVLFGLYFALGAGPARIIGAALVDRLDAAPAGSSARSAAPELARKVMLIVTGFFVLVLLLVILMVWRPGAPANVNDYTG